MVSLIIKQAIRYLMRQAKKKGAPEEVEFLMKDGLEMFVDVTLAVRDGKFTQSERDQIRPKLVRFSTSCVEMFDGIPVSKD
jgi:predicted RNA-binding Zn ribbon-like protein